MLKLVSDKYGREPQLFSGIDEFMDMAYSCFGERPKLTEKAGNYYENGILILESVSPCHLETVGTKSKETVLRAGARLGAGRELARQKWTGPTANGSSQLRKEWALAKAKTLGFTLVDAE